MSDVATCYVYIKYPSPKRLAAEKKLRQYKTWAAGEGFMPRLFPADKREAEGFIVLMIHSRDVCLWVLTFCSDVFLLVGA